MWHILAALKGWALYYEGECITTLQIKEADAMALVTLLNASGAYPERRNPTGS